MALSALDTVSSFVLGRYYGFSRGKIADPIFMITEIDTVKRHGMTLISADEFWRISTQSPGLPWSLIVWRVCSSSPIVLLVVGAFLLVQDIVEAAYPLHLGYLLVTGHPRTRH